MFVPAESKWQLDRLGCFTASEIYRLLTPPKSASAKETGELSVTAMDYVSEKLSELLTGMVQELSGYALLWGKQHEPDAAALLEKQYPGLEYYGTDDPRFFQYTERSGGSPDAVLNKTVFEIKCPENPKNHIEYLKLNDPVWLPKEYYAQLQFNMMCVAKANDIPFSEMQGLFVSYGPYMIDESLQLKILHVPPDPGMKAKLDAVISKAETALNKALQLVESFNP